MNYRWSLKILLIYIHQNLKGISDWLIRLILTILVLFFGFASFWFPLIKIWTDIIDKNFGILKSFGYLLIGVVFLYLAISLHEINDIIKKNGTK